MAQVPFANRLVDSIVSHLRSRNSVSVVGLDGTIWDGERTDKGRIHILDATGALSIIVGLPGESFEDVHEELDWEDDYDDDWT
jgi:hypothetical protein